jgi:hypothetical protein
MANEKQLKFLKQGVKVWNRWREKHPEEKIDLRGAYLAGTNLAGANLRGANLNDANLRGANLDDASLEGANLDDVNLYDANLRGANLRGTNLYDAYLRGANLRSADLRGANLIRTKFSTATITGVNLYGTARDDWDIDGVICDYVFWDHKPYFSDEEKEQEKQWELEHRTPKDRDFRSGEFEELYKQLPMFDYYFEHGFTPIDTIVIDKVVQAINEHHPEFELKLDSFHSRGQPHAKFTVLHKEHVEVAKKHVTSDYETQLAALEGKQEQLMELFSRLTSNPQPQLISGCEQVIIGGTILGDQIKKTAGRDYFEKVGDHTQVRAGDSFYDHAQQLLQTPRPLMDQLNSKEEFQGHYQLLSEKLAELRKAYILETDTEVKFKLRKKIEEAEADLDQIEQRLEALEQEGA